MDEYRLLKKKLQKEKEGSHPTNRVLIRTISEVMISVILLLVGLIVTRNTTWKNEVYKYIYQDNISFKQLEAAYEKYFGKLLPTKEEEKDKDEVVVAEKMEYEKQEEIENGVRLIVKKDSVITAVESGLVIFVGEKEGYGTTLVLEQVDGVEAWYVGVDTKDLKIYDYVEKASIIGTSKEEKVDFYFKKNGEVIDYKNYVF